MARESHHPSPNTFYIEPLETWAAAIKRLPSAAKQCFLERVVHCKALSDMEHEFLVVYASNLSGSKIVLGIDRNAQDRATAALKKTSGSASRDMDTTQPSTAVSSSARYLNTLACAKLPPLSSSLSEEESSHLAYDGVQASLDGDDAPIFNHHGDCVQLYTITFSSTSASSSNSDARRRPSLLHLTVLLLTIRKQFPSYALLEHQCYFFARATCLALMDLYGVVDTELEDCKRAATWRGVHVSVYSAGSKALQNMLLLPLIQYPVLIVPAGLFALYSAVKLYEGNVVGSEADRRRIM